jgi:hypothetical protein
MIKVPPVIAVTTPDESTVAIDGLPLLQTPPVTALVRVLLLPTHTVLVPPIAGGVAGALFTVIDVTAAFMPQALPTV